MSGGLDDLQPDGAVVEGLLGYLVALLAGLQLHHLDGVHLEEAVEMRLLSPDAVVVVVAQLPAGGVDDHRVLPAGQLHQQAGCLAAVKSGGALDWGSEAEALAGRGDGGGVAYLGLNGHYVRHANVSSCASRDGSMGQSPAMTTGSPVKSATGSLATNS